jgi:lysophospholipase
MTHAPLLSVPGQTMPDGGQAMWLKANDGIRLRLASWPKSDAMGSARGTAFLLNGRTEFIEKYADAALDLSRRGFQVLGLDWRGQGLSDRLLHDPARGHVADFADFTRDLDAMVSYARSIDAPRPWVVVAHSMGGHNVLRQAALGQSPFEALALSAPMCRIRLPEPQALIRGIVSLAARVAPQAYAFGQGAPTQADMDFATNTLTSDAQRFEVMVASWRLEPRLHLGGVTFNWLNQALRSMANVLAQGALERVTMPVMIAAAMADRIVDPAIYAQMMPRLARGQLLAIEGAQHEILREADQYRDQFWQGFDRLIAGLERAP